MGLMLIIIIAALAIVAISILIRIAHFKNQIIAIVLILFLLFVYLTSAQIVKSNDIDIGSFKGIEQTSKIYLSWLGGLFGNMKTVTINVIRMDWGFNKANLTENFDEEKQEKKSKKK